MRKSKRISQLESQMAYMQYDLEYFKELLSILLDKSNIKMSDIDAGKWYSNESKK